MAAGAPCCHGQTGKTTQSLHLPRNLNQHLSLLCSVASHSNRLPGQHSLCHGGPGGSQQGVQYTAPRVSPPGLGVPSHSHRGQAGRQGTRGTRSHQGDNRNKYREGAAQAGLGPGPEPVPSPGPGAAVLLAPGMSAGHGDGSIPLGLLRPRWRVTVQGEARARTSMSMVGVARGRGCGPGLVLVLVLWRLFLQLVILWWGKALLGGNRDGTGGHTNPHWAWHEGFGKA